MSRKALVLEVAKEAWDWFEMALIVVVLGLATIGFDKVVLDQLR